MLYQGDYLEDATVYVMFNTFTSNDPSASSTITNFANTDVHIHKDDGLTQRNNAAGITVSIDFDGITGSHMIAIDTSDDTVAAFWVTGSDYFVRIEGTTVDAGTINAMVGHFSIENRFQEVDVVKWLGTAVATPEVAGVPRVANAYENGIVFVDTVSGAAGTTSYVNGTADNPVNSIASAKTIADALNFKRFKILPGSSITLAANYDDYTFDAFHATIALGGSSVDNTIFNGGIITGNDDGTNASPTQYCFCFLSGNTLGQFVFTDCYISGTITLAEAGDYRMHDCKSATAGPGSPNLDFGSALAASDVNMRNHSGGIELENMGAGAGTYNLTLEGEGQLIINANCSATSIVELRGNFKFTDNASGAVTVNFDDDTTGINTLLTQLGGIANTGSAVNIPADSYVLAVGTESSGTFASTAALDGTNHEHTDVGNAMDLYYEFIIGSGIPTDVLVTGYLNSNNDDLEVYGYDWVASAWVRIGTLEGKNASTNEVNSYIMFVNMVGSGANEGIVRVRFTDGAFTLSGATLAIDQIFVSFSRGNEGYDNGAVWFDSGAGNTDTVVGIDGTSRNPVSTEAAVNTLLASTNLHKVSVAPGSSITFATSHDNQVWNGENWTLALGGQSVSATHIIGATVTGICTGASKPTFEKCHFGAVTMPPCHFEGCTLEGTLTIGSAGTFSLARCQSGVPGSGTPILDFGGALNASEVGFRGFSGGIEIQNMGAGTGTYLMTLEGDGQLIINVNCSATSSVELRGDFRVTDNASGAVTVTTDDDTTDINATLATVNHADYGNSKLVRSTTPANTLDVDADGEVDLNMEQTTPPSPTTDTVGEALRKAHQQLPEGPQKNAALSDLSFLMVDATDFATPETGLTVTGQVSKDSGAFAGVAGSIAEIGNGVYTIDATAADMNADLLTFRFSATGAADTFITIKTTPAP